MEPFTEEQKEILRCNPYTFKVSDYRVTYTLEFKRFFMEQIAKGKTSVNIFMEAGYDPEILTRKRIYTFAKFTKEEAKSPEGFRVPKRTKSEIEFAKKNSEHEKTSGAVKDLQKQVTKLEQEVDFLKKISFLQKQYLKDQK